MKFEVTINKKHAYMIIAMIMLVGVFVVAQTSTTPVVSHKLSQITKENGVALDITNTNDGKVGIGTLSPAARLDVVGSTTTGNTMLRVGSPADVNHRGYDVAVVQGGPASDYVGTVLNVQSRSLDETGYVLLNVQNAVANTPSSKLYVRGDGNVGIGTTTPTQKLDVNGVIKESVAGGLFYGSATSNFGSSGKELVITVNNGQGGANDEVWIGPNTGGYVGHIQLAASQIHYSGQLIGPSDRRLKENIQYIPTAIDTIRNLKPATFDFINGQKNRVGFIAQEVQKVLPHLIFTNTNGMLELNEIGILPYAVKAMQEQQQQIEENKKEINMLKIELCKKDKTYSWC